jgi:hypothetical protein
MVEALGLSRLGGGAGQFLGAVVAADSARAKSASGIVKISAIANQMFAWTSRFSATVVPLFTIRTKACVPT